MVHITHVLRGGLCLILLYTLALILNLFQVIVYLVRPISTNYYRVLSSELISMFYYSFVSLTMYSTGIEVITYSCESSRIDILEFLGGYTHALFISNHVAYTDWVVVFCIISSIGEHRMRYLKFIWNSVGAYLPAVGWGAYLADFIFIRRDDKDALKLKQQLQSYNKANFPIWLSLFPEGTFIDDDNHEKLPASQEFAKSMNYSIKDYVLVPRTRGFNTVINELGDDLAVIDACIVYTDSQNDTVVYNSYLPLCQTGMERTIPGVLDLFLGPNTLRAHVHLEVHNAKDIQKGDPKSWIVEKFASKEIMLRHFEETGTFPGNASRLKHRSSFTEISRIFVLVCFAVLVIVFLCILPRYIAIACIAFWGIWLVLGFILIASSYT